MRITAGELKGRAIKVPDGPVRPSQDRLRQSLFSSLGPIDGWRVLDLFAGSGALGLEAWSRGAREVVWIERHPRVYAVLRDNVQALCRGDPARPARCLRGDALDLDRWGRELGRFDLVLADPPYELTERDQIVLRLLQALPASGLLGTGGRLAVEARATHEWPVLDGWERVRARGVGDSAWCLYHRTGPAGPSIAG